MIRSSDSRLPWAAFLAVLWGGGLLWLYLAQKTAPPTLDAVIHAITCLLLLLFFAAGFTALGMPVVSALLDASATGARPIEQVLYAFGIGSAALSLLIFVGGLAGVFSSWFFLTICVIAGLAACFTGFSDAVADARQAVSAGTLALAAPFLLLAAACAFVEPASTDALLYHLAVPASYLREHSIAPIPNNFFSFWPMGTEMLYALAFELGRETAPALINLLFAIGSLLWLETLKSRSVLIGPAALFISMPAMTINAGFPYADFALTFYVLSAYAAFERLRSAGGFRWALLTGAFCSAAVATKYTGFYAVAALGILLLASRETRRLRLALAFTAAMLIFGGPWLARNLVYKGNPVYPYFTSLFGLSSADTYRADRQAHELTRIEGDREAGWSSTARMPYYYTFKQPFLDYALGPLPAIMLPVLLFGLARHWRLLAFAGLFVIPWVAFSPQTRHLFPAIGLLAVALSKGLQNLIDRYPSVRKPALAVVIAVMFVSWFHLLFFYRQTFDPVRRLIGAESRDQFLGRVCQDWPAIRFLNAHMREQDVLLTAGQMNSFYIGGRVYPESKFDTPLAVTLTEGCRDSDEYAKRLERLGISYILVNQAEIRRMAWIPGEYLDFQTEDRRRIFDSFLAEHCLRVFEITEIAVYRLSARRDQR